ncbi:hypothetical protein CDCA_CDCA03G0883 [Cyanidium caldarium]|uniref:Pentacotripeptide-repeat region of PRORP domain-containing protein n=1 Tax=Cyanidium caldarium TaxID=2771 RepID=A0AAV9ISJ5_CYACA|nr:hypothetical protein CDCA_CDCA03G0883 [Cyanidium caldarium]
MGVPGVVGDEVRWRMPRPGVPSQSRWRTAGKCEKSANRPARTLRKEASADGAVLWEVSALVRVQAGRRSSSPEWRGCTATRSSCGFVANALDTPKCRADARVCGRPAASWWTGNSRPIAGWPRAIRVVEGSLAAHASPTATTPYGVEMHRLGSARHISRHRQAVCRCRLFLPGHFRRYRPSSLRTLRACEPPMPQSADVAAAMESSTAATGDRATESNPSELQVADSARGWFGSLRTSIYRMQCRDDVKRTRSVLQHGLSRGWPLPAALLNALMARCLSMGEAEAALRFFDEFATACSEGPTVECHTTRITAYGHLGRPQEALRVFQELRQAAREQRHCDDGGHAGDTAEDDHTAGVDVEPAAAAATPAATDGTPAARPPTDHRERRQPADGRTASAETALKATPVDARRDSTVSDDPHRSTAHGSARAIAPNANTYNAVIAACLSAGKWNTAQSLLRQMVDEDHLAPNDVTYNTILNWHARTGDVDSMEQVRQRMRQAGCQPSLVTYSTLIKGYARARQMDRARATMEEALSRRDLQPDARLFNTLIDGYVSCLHWEAAVEVLNEMMARGVPPDPHTYTQVLKVCVRAGRLDRAERLLERIPPPWPLHVYTLMISAYGAAGRLGSALATARRMRADGVPENEVSYAACMGACLNAHEPELALSTYERMRREQPDLRPDVVLFTLCIRAHGLRGRVDECLHIYDAMCRARIWPNVVTHNALIEASVRAGAAGSACRSLKRLLRSTHSPDRHTYAALLCACLPDARQQLNFLARAWDALRQARRNPTGHLYIAVLQLSMFMREYALAERVLADRLAGAVSVGKQHEEEARAYESVLVATVDNALGRPTPPSPGA